MKKNFFFMAALLVAMTGCNKESEIKEKENINPEDKVYMSFSIKAAGTRSATDEEGDTNSDATPDYEVGKDYENTISKVDIVLANDDSYVVANDVRPSGSVGNKYIAEFSSLELEAEKEYKVYIYANCDAPATTKDLHATSNATIEEMTANHSFWMTNAYEARTVTMPEHMSIHTSPASPLNLGAHSVERSMARIDIKPTHKYDNFTENTFIVDSGDEDYPIYVTLTEAALINHSIDFYQLRRVSADGTDANWVVGGVETPDNYVVDADYADKAYGARGQVVISVKKGELFTSHMTMPETWEWIPMPTSNDKNTDNWEGATGNEDYHIWQYCKENTIPGVDIQEKGITTGVVFKAAIHSEKYEIEDAMEAGHVLFLFENVFYGPWHAVKAAAAEPDAPTTLVAAVAEVESANIPSYEIGKPQHKQIYEQAGFTGFSREEDESGRIGKYYTYYYYWIRHNDNGDNAVMGPMEFAVVRNNVYKLCVENIYKLGHPTPGKDPDPNPEYHTDPDESLNYYFNVTVDVLPWTVRVNNIEF